MPALSMEEMNLLLDEIAKTAIPCTLNLGREAEEKAIKECDEYLENGNKDIAGMSPFSIYHVISKLSDDEKIDFIKNNIEYIKEHEKDIFLYTMYAPKSLSYFFSFKVLKELKKIDINIFKEVIGQNFENLFYGFKHEDYYDFYNEFYSDLMEVNNRCFINGLYCHNRCCYDKASIYDINKVYDVQRDYNKEFMNYILEKYDEKINKLSPSDLLSFIEFIEDIEVYKDFINKHYDKLNTAFYNISEYNLHDYLSETNAVKQEVLIYSFFENIIEKQNIKSLISNISPNIIIDLYKKHKEVFSPLTLKDWIKVCSSPRVFNDDFKAILDSFEIDNIEELFDTECYSNRWLKDYVASLNYVENKFRNNIKITGKLEEIDITTSIFSEKYIRNLSELKIMLQNNVISKNDECYKKHLTNFILFLKTTNTINNIEGNRLKEISNLFYRIVMGKSLTVLYELSSIEEITLLNRLGSVEFNVDDFSVEQLEKYNVKQHK